MKNYHIIVSEPGVYPWKRHLTIQALNEDQARRLADRRLEPYETIESVVELPVGVTDPYQEFGYADSMGLWRGIGWSCLFLVIVVALVLLGLLLFHHFAWPAGW